jgi:hypothetical protein
MILCAMTVPDWTLRRQLKSLFRSLARDACAGVGEKSQSVRPGFLSVMPTNEEETRIQVEFPKWDKVLVLEARRR